MTNKSVILIGATTIIIIVVALLLLYKKQTAAATAAAQPVGANRGLILSPVSVISARLSPVSVISASPSPVSVISASPTAQDNEFTQRAAVVVVPPPSTLSPTQQAINAAIVAIDKTIYNGLAFSGKTALLSGQTQSVNRPAYSPKDFTGLTIPNMGNLEYTWECCKWLISDVPYPVPMFFDDTNIDLSQLTKNGIGNGKWAYMDRTMSNGNGLGTLYYGDDPHNKALFAVDNQGRYFAAFGYNDNEFKCKTDTDRANKINNFVTKWKQAQNYRPASDLTVLSKFAGLAAALISGNIPAIAAFVVWDVS